MADNKDLFAPPTKEEMDLMAPPSSAELKDDGVSFTFTEPVGGAESFARGAAQGLSLGFADEITGALEALGDVATTEKTLSDLPELYTQHRDESRQAYKASEEANPITALLGNIAGGIPTAIAAGVLAPAVKGAPITKKIWDASKLGAEFGAATGLGFSEADNLVGMGKDVLAGGAIGGITGGLTEGVLMPLVSRTGEAAKGILKSGPLKEVAGQFKYGLNNERLIGADALDDVSKNLISTLDDVKLDVKQRKDLLNKVKDFKLAEADKIGEKANLEEWYKGAKAAIQSLRDEFHYEPKLIAELDKVDDIIEQKIFGSDYKNVRALNKKLNELNVKAAAHREATQEALDKGERTFVASKAGEQANVVDNELAGFVGSGEDAVPVFTKKLIEKPKDVQYITKDGKVIDAKLMKKVREALKTENGPKLTGNKIDAPGDMMTQANIMEAATRSANKEFADSGLPYYAKVFEKDGETYATIFDLSSKGSPKPLGKPIKIDADTGMFTQVELAPKFDFLPSEVHSLRGTVGNLGTFGDTPAENTRVRELVNRLIKADPGRELSRGEQALGLNPKAKQLNELMDELIPRVEGPSLDQDRAYSGIQTKLSELIRAEQNAPSITNLKNVAKENHPVTKQEMDKFTDLLPDDLKQTIMPKIEKASEKYQLAQSIAHPGLSHGVVDRFTRNVIYGGANIAGLLGWGMKEGVKNLYSIPAPLFNRLGSEIRATYSNNPAMKETAERLASLVEKASEGNVAKRNAILFSIEQNPTYREMLYGKKKEE